MRRMREDHLHRNYSDVNERPIRCRAKLIQPKAGMAVRLAMIPSAYNGTFCPATAASNGGSSERSSEGLDSRWALPGAGSFNRPTVREVVSNRTEQKTNFRNGEGRSAIQGNVRCCQQTAERPMHSNENTAVRIPDRRILNLFQLCQQMCFQQRVLQRSMILMRLPPAGLEKVKRLFRPPVILAPKVTPRGAALEFSILLPHGAINAVAV